MYEKMGIEMPEATPKENTSLCRLHHCWNCKYCIFTALQCIAAHTVCSMHTMHCQSNVHSQTLQLTLKLMYSIAVLTKKRRLRVQVILNTSCMYVKFQIQVVHKRLELMDGQHCSVNEEEGAEGPSLVRRWWLLSGPWGGLPRLPRAQGISYWWW